MEFYVPLQEAALVALLLAIFYLGPFVKRAKGGNTEGEKTLPPELPGAWPIIGHHHLLGTNNLFHRILGDMADKHGPIFIFRQGFQRYLVISNSEVAKECFTINDKAFATRPRSLAGKLMAYDHGLLGLAPYGGYWRHVRKLATIELLSAHRLEMLKHVRDSETNFFVRNLYKHWYDSKSSSNPLVVEMKQRFGDLAMNIIGRMIAGKQHFGAASTYSNTESRRCQKAMGDFMRLLGLFLVSDAVPWLGWVDELLGYKSEIKQTAKEIDVLFGNWVKEHKQKRLHGTIEEEEEDFIHTMLSVMQSNGQNMSDETDRVIKATCLALILGGNDTTAITLTWALSLLLNNHHVLSHAQSELELYVGRHRQVQESDIKNLVYLQAIVKETLRLYPAAPLAVPHEAMEDCTVAGFYVPAGTRLLVNLWKLHRDPQVWSDPLKFNPERFLREHTNLDVRGQDFELLPFSSGRRMCPGITFSLQVLHLALARLLHSFNFGTISNSLVDMTEGTGITIPKVTPLEVTFTPRLPSDLYMD